jgi:hypothetical protein
MKLKLYFVFENDGNVLIQGSSGMVSVKSPNLPVI